MAENGLTAREIFQRLIELQNENMKLQRDMITKFDEVSKELKIISEKIDSISDKLFKILFFLLSLVAALVGVKGLSAFLH